MFYIYPLNLHFHDVNHYEVEHDQQDQGEVIDKEEEGQGMDFVEVFNICAKKLVMMNDAVDFDFIWILLKYIPMHCALIELVFRMFLFTEIQLMLLKPKKPIKLFTKLCKINVYKSNVIKTKKAI